MRAAIAVAASLLLLAAGASAGKKAYECDAASCNSKPTCMCASTSPPGGLNPKDVPQFIVLTNDDSVSSVTYPVIRSITDQHKNSNGCPMPATWFIQTQYTDPKLVQQLYMDNHEVATHTVTHPSYPNASEILGARKWLNEVAGIPLQKIKGFRAPFLLHDQAQRAILRENGFLYDSSITEQFGEQQASPSGGKKIYPFTMDAGIPIDCTVGTGSCGEGETQPGLWEFPLWAVQGADNAVIASMDPQGDNFEIYQREFERNYNGNRCPLGMYLHAGLLMAFSQNQKGINDFLDWALQKPDVWVVTISEVLRWMKNPVPASQYKLDCTKPTDLAGGGKFCPEPVAGCGQGSWNDDRCACDCLYQQDSSAAGFCPGPDGTCTIQKLYDDTARMFYCPGQNYLAPPSPSPSPAVATAPVSFAFYITGSTHNDILYNKATSICDALTQVALESGSQCEVSTVNDVTGSGQQVTKIYVEVTIQSTKPSNAKLALQSAAQYGALSTALQSVGVTFDSVAGTDGAQAPAPAGDAQAPGPAPATNDTEGGSSNVGAIVGGVVGGLAAVALAAVTVFLVLRHRKKQRTAAGSSAPSHAPSPKAGNGPQVHISWEDPTSLRAKYAGPAAAVAPQVGDRQGSAISVMATNVLAAHSTSFNGSPRSNITPRQSVLARQSGEHTGV